MTRHSSVKSPVLIPTYKAIPESSALMSDKKRKSERISDSPSPLPSHSRISRSEPPASEKSILEDSNDRKNSFPNMPPLKGSQKLNLPQKTRKLLVAVTGFGGEDRGAVMDLAEAVVAICGGKILNEDAHLAEVCDVVVAPATTKACRRTLRIIFSLARGVPVVTEAWLYACLEGGVWLPFTESTSDVGVDRKRRRYFDDEEALPIAHPRFGCNNPTEITYKASPLLLLQGLNVFLGYPYDSKDSVATADPSRPVLALLIQVCGGTVTEEGSEADIAFLQPGGNPNLPTRNGEAVLALLVKELFDAIENGELPYFVANRMQIRRSIATSTSSPRTNENVGRVNSHDALPSATKEKRNSAAEPRAKPPKNPRKEEEENVAKALSGVAPGNPGKRSAEPIEHTKHNSTKEGAPSRKRLQSKVTEESEEEWSDSESKAYHAPPGKKATAVQEVLKENLAPSESNKPKNATTSKAVGSKNTSQPVNAAQNSSKKVVDPSENVKFTSAPLASKANKKVQRTYIEEDDEEEDEDEWSQPQHQPLSNSKTNRKLPTSSGGKRARNQQDTSRRPLAVTNEAVLLELYDECESPGW